MPGIDDLGGFGKPSNTPAKPTKKPDHTTSSNAATSATQSKVAKSLPNDVQQAMLRSMQGVGGNHTMKLKYNDLIRGALAGCEQSLDVHDEAQIVRIALLHLHKSLTDEWPQPFTKKKLGRWL